LRHDVRDNFEEYVTGITEQTGDTGVADTRPITEQAAGMMDQLALMEQMMQTSTFTEALKRTEVEETVDEDETVPEVWVEAQQPSAPPAFPTYRLD
jgi:hypothetical protein